MGWGNFLDKAISKLPIQDRKERWRNQIDSLEQKKKKLLNEKWGPKNAKHMADIESKLAHLNRLCKNQE